MITFAPFRYLDRPVSECSRAELARLIADASPGLALEGIDVALRELGAFCDVRRDPLPGAVVVDRRQRTLRVVGRFGHRLRVRCDEAFTDTLMLSDWLEVAHDATVIVDPFADAARV